MNSQQTRYLSWNDLQTAWGSAVLHARFKQTPEDFRVDEDLGFEPDGHGEHLMLQVQKSGLTTADVHAMLARHYSLAMRDVSYAGMKDRQGVTSQWFSLHLPGKAAALPDLPQHSQLRILNATRNSRKLRRGSHRGNRFHIVLRQPEGDRDACLQRLQHIATHGVPNYFGLQRFGRHENNVPAALAWFHGDAKPGRFERSMYLSAARSYLFNALLSVRVETRNWNSWITGDVMALAGAASTFASSRAQPEELERRLQTFDISATGPLWGDGALPVTEAALALESHLAVQYPELTSGLHARGLVQERRPLRLRVDALQGSFDNAGLQLAFSLPRGTYATAVLRELLAPEST